MIKKTILAFVITTGFVVNADVTLDARLLISKDAYQRDVQRTIVVSDAGVAIAAEDVEEYALEATVVGYAEDGVVVSFKVLDYDNGDNAVVVAEPTIKCVWDTEAIIELSNISDENGNEEVIRLSVIASRN